MVWPHRLMRSTVRSGRDICKVGVVYEDVHSDTNMKRLVHCLKKLDVLKAKGHPNRMC